MSGDDGACVYVLLTRGGVSVACSRESGERETDDTAKVCHALSDATRTRRLLLLSLSPLSPSLLHHQGKVWRAASSFRFSLSLSLLSRAPGSSLSPLCLSASSGIRVVGDSPLLSLFPRFAHIPSSVSSPHHHHAAIPDFIRLCNPYSVLDDVSLSGSGNPDRMPRGGPQTHFQPSAR